MKAKRINFFALKNDISSLIGEIERVTKIRATPIGDVSKEQMKNPISLANIPNLGVSPSPDNALNPAYLVWATDDDIRAREVNLKGGGIRNIVDQRNNPQTVILRPGGERPEGGIICGEISTIYDTAESLYLYRLFEKLIKMNFTKIKSYYVGTEASRALQSGVRLTSNINSPTEYDLTFD